MVESVMLNKILPVGLTKKREHGLGTSLRDFVCFGEIDIIGRADVIDFSGDILVMRWLYTYAVSQILYLNLPLKASVINDPFQHLNTDNLRNVETGLTRGQPFRGGFIIQRHDGTGHGQASDVKD